MRIPDTHEPVRGFSLVELAIVVTIVMTLLTLGLGVMNAQVSSAASSITKKRQEAIKDALVAYLGANRRLPCPASGTATTGDTIPPGTGSPACSQFGIVPFATLGFSREVAEDGWGNFFSYQVYSDPSPTPPPLCPSNRWDWGNRECFGEGKDGINSSKVALRINDGTVATSTPLSDKGIAVVISHGPNGLGAWASQGTRNAPPTTCEEAHNAVGAIPSPSGCTPVSNTFYKGERQENDDVVAYLTASEALQALVRQGTIKSAMAKVNEDLQTLADMAVGVRHSSVSISLLGGLLNINSAGCSASVSPPPSMLDPWGQQYDIHYASSGFPICFSSRGGALSAICQPSGSCNPNPSPLCRSIDTDSFNALLARAGVASGCP